MNRNFENGGVYCSTSAAAAAGSVPKSGTNITFEWFECDKAETPVALGLCQYVARPPETSNTAPVENEQSSDASHAIIAASSSTITKRFIGIFDSM